MKIVKMFCRRRIHGACLTWLAAALALSTGLLLSGSVYASETAASAPVRTASFPTQVYNFEKMLEAENDVLSFRDAAREAAPSYDPDYVPEGADTPAGPTPEQFLADIKDSYEARLSVIRRFSDFTQMSPDTYLAFCALCAEAERPFYELYRTLEFSNLNYQVLCRGYLLGLEKQYEAVSMAEDPKAEDSAVQAAYFEGYTMRSNILLELNHFYYPEVSGLEEVESLSGTRDMASIVDSAKEKNKEAPEELTKRVQSGLNAAGFDCGTPDGIAGTNTVLSICHFQRSRKMNEDGLVTEELASMLPAPEEGEG